MQVKITYLDNGIKKVIIAKTEKEQIEFYQKARSEGLALFKVEKL